MDDNKEKSDFIRDIIKDYLYSESESQDNAGRTGNVKKIHTRFPPEPNGYLHIGHAKAICLNFGLASEFGGKCNLRFDDTNPTKEEQEYVDSIVEDIKWLGFDWGDREFYASNYFDKLYEFALMLIKKGCAYVCDLSSDEIREYRGTLKEPGKESPYRERSIDENLRLFKEMREGIYPDGSKVLRAKIDMSSPNLNMRDPIMYRILHRSHHRTKDKWCIYPTYDWAHGQSDSIEGITHSICTLEFEDHRPLYDWFIEQLEIHHPQQIEFARLNLTYTVMSKRMLLELVDKKHVSGWDDPRMPTISGMRRRGYPPEAIRNFCSQIGVAKADSTVDFAFLEYIIRENLNKNALRRMAVLNPLKVIIDNYPEGKIEELTAINNPEDENAGVRTVPFSKVIYIEKEDFMEEPPKKFYRLAPGREVRLRYAYFIRCESIVKDDEGNILELHCTYDPQTKGGDSPDGRKVKATLHWVSGEHSIPAEVRLYGHLFAVENPYKTEEGGDFKDNLNPESLKIINGCRLEPSLLNVKPKEIYQFERLGYFCADIESTKEKIIFNRTATLKDEWAKIKKSC
ncbi:MAG: glutamine--tRNA ligase/YqeY domain fusion protein [Actinomycetota bacterium]|nr:glutamine--tRNA ligase/YqeY domain fusion protein [Actinomycetota bacterium]